jgi:cyclase
VSLKKRVVGIWLVHQGRLCRTKNFEPDYFYTDAFLDTSAFDELMIIDVTRNPNQSSGQFRDFVSRQLATCFLPVTVGGGISTLHQARELLDLGVDRIVIGSGAYMKPDLIPALVAELGSQAVVAGIDIRLSGEGDYELPRWPKALISKRPDPRAWLEQIEQWGVGEVILNSWDRDGSLRGLDLEAMETLSESITVPIILVGGLGNWRQLALALQHPKVSGVGTSNIFHLTPDSVSKAKQVLMSEKVSVRV